MGLFAAACHSSPIRNLPLRLPEGKYHARGRLSSLNVNTFHNVVEVVNQIYTGGKSGPSLRRVQKLGRANIVHGCGFSAPGRYKPRSMSRGNLSIRRAAHEDVRVSLWAVIVDLQAWNQMQ
jgi:hypothetical protein